MKPIYSRDYCSGQNEIVERRKTEPASDIDKIFLLIFLYFLQGVPLGMTAAIPLLLQSQPQHPPDLPKRLAVFSTAAWPFALKFLFAPAVDSVKLPYLGVRKSWLLISQTGISMALIVASSNIYESVLEFDVRGLLGLFFPLCLCAAVQDVAVDGWALGLLRTPSWASTCNCVGQSAGFIFGTATLTLIDWKYSRQLFWWLGIIFLCSTILLLVLKKEKNSKHKISAVTASATYYHMTVNCPRSIFLYERIHQLIFFCGGYDNGGAYKEMIEVIRLPSFTLVAIFHMTSRVSFAVVDHVLGLQLIERGIIDRKSLPKLVLLISTPIQILLPFIIGKLIAVHRQPTGGSLKTSSLGIFMYLYWPRTICATLLSAMTLWAGSGCQIGKQKCIVTLSALIDHTACYRWVTDSDRCIAFAACLLLLFVAYKIFAVSMFVATMAFHAEISDTRLAGTCMTLANAVANLGAAWPEVIVLYLASTESTVASSDPLISNKISTRFGILSIICFVVGFVWYRVFSGDLIHRLTMTSWFLSARKRQS